VETHHYCVVFGRICVIILFNASFSDIIASFFRFTRPFPFITKLFIVITRLIRLSAHLYRGLIFNPRSHKFKRQKKQPLRATLFTFAWRRPTLTGGDPPTTIGAEELNFRVRHGNGCDLFAIVTRRIIQLKDCSFKTR
jgi:hypothetical protein